MGRLYEVAKTQLVREYLKGELSLTQYLGARRALLDTEIAMLDREGELLDGYADPLVQDELDLHGSSWDQD